MSEIFLDLIHEREDMQISISMTSNNTIKTKPRKSTSIHFPAISLDIRLNTQELLHNPKWSEFFELMIRRHFPFQKVLRLNSEIRRDKKTMIRLLQLGAVHRMRKMSQ